MSEGIFRRRRLPHWDVEDATYFVTSCLEGSIPALGLARLKKLRADLDRRPRLPGLSIEQWEIHKHNRLFAEFDKIIDNQPVARGDVVVFRYPVDPRQDYIKRVVGLPGDEVSYLNQKLSINGQPVAETPRGEQYDEDSMSYAPVFVEKLGQVEHLIRVDPFAQNCRYVTEGVTCKVPAGHYFMMGDNRDNSLDSRFWGFVPDENLVGKAFFVWMNFGNLRRIGPFQ